MPSKSKPKRKPAPLSSPLGHIAENVRLRRRAMGLTQAGLSEFVPCHPTYVSQIERRVTNISVERLERLAEVFGVDALTLMQPPNAVTEPRDGGSGDPGGPKAAIGADQSAPGVKRVRGKRAQRS